MQTQMLAAVVDRYGPPEAVRVVERPVPGLRRGEVLVEVAAASVTSGDARMRSGTFPRGFALPARLAIGLRGPRCRTLGVAFSGRIVALGPNATGLAVGDEVAGMTGARCGAHAQFVAVSAQKVTPKPAATPHTDAAAALFGGSTARHFLIDRAGLRAGESVLVNGASGSVGSAAVQLASGQGAEVTTVSSRANHPLLRRLGATHVVDYRQTPVTELSERFDVVFDAVGNLRRPDALRLARPDGRVVLAVASLGETIAARGRVLAGPAAERADAFADVLALVADGSFDPLTEIVGGLDALPAAYARIDSGRKIGNLVVVLR